MFRYFLLLLLCSVHVSLSADTDCVFGLKVVSSQPDMNQDRHYRDNTYKNLLYRSCPLDGYDACNTILSAVHFTCCSGKKINFSGVTFNVGSLQKCFLNRAQFSDAILREVVFDHVDATNMNCTNTIFEDCTLSEVVSDGLVLDGTIFRGSHLRGLDWSKANIQSFIIDEKTSVEGLVLPFDALSHISIEGRDGLDRWEVLSYLRDHGVKIIGGAPSTIFTNHRSELKKKLVVKEKKDLPEHIFSKPCEVISQVPNSINSGALPAREGLRQRKIKKDQDSALGLSLDEDEEEQEEVVSHSSLLSFLSAFSPFKSCISNDPDEFE